MNFSCVEKRMHGLLNLGVPGCSIRGLLQIQLVSRGDG